MKKINLLIATMFAFVSTSQAEIKVAFFKCFDAKGKLIQLVPNGQFCHVAIKYKEGWVHAHPLNGVEYKPRLSDIKIGEFSELLYHPQPRSLTAQQVHPWIGAPYDNSFNWDSTEKTYCSKLVGKFLGIPPKAMTFETPYWKNFKNLPVGELGISPDAIYLELLKRGYY